MQKTTMSMSCTAKFGGDAKWIVRVAASKEVIAPTLRRAEGFGDGGVGDARDETRRGGVQKGRI